MGTKKQRTGGNRTNEEKNRGSQKINEQQFHV